MNYRKNDIVIMLLLVMTIVVFFIHTMGLMKQNNVLLSSLEQLNARMKVIENTDMMQELIVLKRENFYLKDQLRKHGLEFPKELSVTNAEETYKPKKSNDTSCGNSGFLIKDGKVNNKEN